MVAVTAAAHRNAAFAEESAEVEVLYASLERMKNVTKKIQSSMSRLDETGRTMQDAIGPIYANTQRLQTQNANINKILQSIEKVKQPLDLRGKEEQIIRGRPERVGLGEYIASIDRTNQALRELKTSNLRSNQAAVAELSSLLAVGIGNLENIFRDLLRQEAQPIEPLKQITQGQDFPRISPSRSAQLRTINANTSNYASLTTSSTTPTDLSPSAKVYALERGQYIATSLQNLATACVSTARKVNPETTYKPGSCAISTYARGLQGMYLAEYESICPIFSREEWGPVLIATCHDSLRTFSSTLRDLDTHVKSHPISDCYLSYEIIEIVSNMSFQIEDRTGELKHAISDALKPIRETAKTSLSLLLNDIRSRISQIVQLPVSGETVPLVEDVMTRLQLMTSYLAPLSSIMRSLGDGGWSAHPSMASHANSTASIPTLKSFDVGADGRLLFQHYASDLLDTLLAGLESRAKTSYKDRSPQGVFLSNTLATIERMISTSDLATLLPPPNPKLDAWRKKALALFSVPWRDLTVGLMVAQHTNKQPRPPSGSEPAADSSAILKSLSSKDRDSIKEKWRVFNVSLDEQVLRFRGFKIEAGVRRELVRGVQEILLPLYQKFWERYHEVDKGKGKYVKYDPSQLSALLEGLK